jgi:hypothetical protein
VDVSRWGGIKFGAGLQGSRDLSGAINRDCADDAVLNEPFAKTCFQGDSRMEWIILTFGKHAGCSLPEIILSDPDWFLWAIKKDVFYGRLAEQAKLLLEKARRIKIPKRHAERWNIEYRCDNDGSFRGFNIIRCRAGSEFVHSSCRRANHLDLLSVRPSKTYDKGTYRRLIRDFRRHYFGKRAYLTKRRCERFFDDESNFVKRP